MKIPLRYNALSLFRRRLSTVLTAGAIALVVAVFIVTMSLDRGIQQALKATGNPLHVLVLRQGSTAETSSFVSREAHQVIRDLPGIVQMDRRVAVARTGLTEADFPTAIVPLAAQEGLYLISLRRFGETAASNVIIRGITPTSLLVRPEINVVAGRMFRPGLREVIVSRSIAGRYENCGIGSRLKFGRDFWTVVGHFDAGGTAFNSEIWGDVHELGADFDRRTYSSVTIRATDSAAAEKLIERLKSDPRLGLLPQYEAKYYESQQQSGTPIKILGSFLATVMAIGACFAAMNTMYASVANRGREIGTLKVLGYSPRAILISFLFESMLMSLIGGIVGVLLTLPINGLTTGAGNFKTFSELTFQFAVTQDLIVKGLLFSIAMGLIGGALPAWAAARRTIISTLKEG